MINLLMRINDNIDFLSAIMLIIGDKYTMFLTNSHKY